MRSLTTSRRPRGRRHGGLQSSLAIAIKAEQAGQITSRLTETQERVHGGQMHLMPHTRFSPPGEQRHH
jgi:hypothetical protein